jgi:hypothetical protein
VMHLGDGTELCKTEPTSTAEHLDKLRSFASGETREVEVRAEGSAGNSERSPQFLSGRVGLELGFV